jgi:multiple sugar transport system permease protein
MATVEQTRPQRRATRFGNRGGLAGYFFVAPSIIFIVLFVIIPIIGALYYSFTRYDLMSSPRWVGLLNYTNLLEDTRYPAAIRNTLAFAFGTVPAGVITSLLLAILINRKLRGIFAYRAMFYMPVVSSFVAVSLIWLWFYDVQIGLFNDILETIGLSRMKWLRSPDTALASIILLSVWKNMGLNMVIYMAGLQGIPGHLYEAAEIDGAGRWSQFWKVTLPLLAPTTFFVVIVYFIGALQMFIQVLIMTVVGGASANSGWSGGPVDSTVTVVLLVYSNAFEYLKMGFASAMSFVLFLIIGVITIINTRLLRYDIDY